MIIVNIIIIILEILFYLKKKKIYIIFAQPEKSYNSEEVSNISSYYRTEEEIHGSKRKEIRSKWGEETDIEAEIRISEQLQNVGKAGPNIKSKTPASPFTYTHGIQNSDQLVIGTKNLPDGVYELFKTFKGSNFDINTILYAKDWAKVKPTMPEFKYYPYGFKTPNFTNLQLIKQILSNPGFKLNTKEYFTFTEVLIKRQHLMDLAGIYYYTRAYNDFKEFLEVANKINPNFNVSNELLQPSLRTLKYFAAWSVLEYRLRLLKGAKWEDWKEIHGYHNQYNMVANNDFYSIKQDMLEHALNETRGQYDEDHIKGTRRDRVSSQHLGEVFYIERMNQQRAHTFLEGIEYRLKYRENVMSNFGFWGFRDYFMYRNRWPIPHKEFMMIHQRYKHLEIVMFQEVVTKKAIYYAQKMKLASKYLLKVEKSKHDILYNKKLSFGQKIKKVLSGDAWIRDFFPSKWHVHRTKEDILNPELEAVYWADEFRSGAEPEEMTSLTQFDHNNPHRLNSYTGRYKIEYYLPLEKYWKFVDPSFIGNKLYFFKYFDPWLESLKKTKKRPMGDSKHPNIFWFKYSHSEVFFLRKADGSRIDPVRFQSGWLYRNFERHMQRLWLKTIRSNSTNENYSQWFGWNDKFNISHAKLPIEVWPASIITKYYEYAGPTHWVVIPAFAMLDETDPYDSEQYVGTFTGPTFLPTIINYKQWIDCFNERERFFWVYKTCLYFMKTSIIFTLPKFLIFLLCLIFTTFLIFWFCLQIKSSNEIEPRYWPCIKVLQKPDYTTKSGQAVTVKLYKNDDGSEALVFHPSLNIPGKSRNNFNILIATLLFLPLTLFVYLPLFKGPTEFFILSQCYLDFFLLTGSLGFIQFIWYYIKYKVKSYYKKIETPENFEIFQKAWAEERRLTWEAEREYEKRYIERYTKMFGKKPTSFGEGKPFKFH